MCFSAQASFTASILLAFVGALALIKARRHQALMLFAATPFLFAIQQCCEGIIWITTPDTFLYSIATRFYLIFAYLVWPLWFPISTLLPEKKHRLKQILYTALLAGVCFDIYAITQMHYIGFWARITDSHLLYPYYGSSSNFNLASSLYLYATIIPLIMSSLQYTRLIAAVIVGSLLFSASHYPAHVTSTWCFFAAIISSLILFTIETEVK